MRLPISNNLSVFRMHLLVRLLRIPMIGLLAAFVCASQQPSATQDRERQLQQAYAKHDEGIRHALPTHSGPPLLLNLSNRTLEDGVCDSDEQSTWQSHYSGLRLLVTGVVDHGVQDPSDATTTTLTTIDYLGPIYSLPAKGSSAVVIATPLSGGVCISANHAFVYTKFTLSVLKDFRKPEDNAIQIPQERRELKAVQLGGSIRFPSGYLETFLWSQEGFVEIGKQCVLFMWRPLPSDDTLMIAEAYLIENGMVFPVSTNSGAQTVYTNMPFAKFEAIVKDVVARNVDANGTESKKRRH